MLHRAISIHWKKGRALLLKLSKTKIMFIYLGTAKSENEWEPKYQLYFFMYIYEKIYL